MTESEILKNTFATLVGRQLTDVGMKTYPNGDKYTVLYFGDLRYEFLSHFTANDHQVAVAKEALERIQQYSGTNGAAIATEVLEKMETFKNETTLKPDEKSTATVEGME